MRMHAGHRNECSGIIIRIETSSSLYWKSFVNHESQVFTVEYSQPVCMFSRDNYIPIIYFKISTCVDEMSALLSRCEVGTTLVRKRFWCENVAFLCANVGQLKFAGRFFFFS